MVKLLFKYIFIILGFSFFFTCKKDKMADNENTFVDPRDGISYKTIKIGNQVWFAENLRYLPKMVALQWFTSNDPFYAIGSYNESSVSEAKATSYYKNYGVSYNWKAAQSACPPGWHIPTPEEWETLIAYCGGWDVAAAKLKVKDTLYWINNSELSGDNFKFGVLPGGSGPLIQDTCIRACFWNSRDTIDNGKNVIGIYFLNEVNNVNKYYSLNGRNLVTLSIRLVKD